MPPVVLPSAPVLFWIVPPEPGGAGAGDVKTAGAAGGVEDDAAPAVPPPVPDEMLSKVTPAAPIVVLATLSAVPLVGADRCCRCR